MVKQKIVLKLALDDERKRRKAFKAAVGMAGVISETMEGGKVVIAGDGVDPITLTTMLRHSLGYTELLSVSSGDNKRKDKYGYGYGGEKKDGYGYGGADSGGGMSYGGGSYSKNGRDGGGGGYHQNVVSSVLYPAYQHYNTMPSYPVYSYPLIMSSQNMIPVAA